MKRFFFMDRTPVERSRCQCELYYSKFSRRFKRAVLRSIIGVVGRATLNGKSYVVIRTGPNRIWIYFLWPLKSVISDGYNCIVIKVDSAMCLVCPENLQPPLFWPARSLRSLYLRRTFTLSRDHSVPCLLIEQGNNVIDLVNRNIPQISTTLMTTFNN